MADPEFPRRGMPTPVFEAKTYYLARFLAENCMKVKEIGPGVRVPSAPLDPPMMSSPHSRVNELEV